MPFCLLLFLSTLLTAQEDSDPFLMLKSGHKMVEPNLDRLQAQKPSPDELFNDYYFRLVQFHDLPDSRKRSRMESYGIRFMDYLPRNAYFTAIHDSFPLAKLKDWDIRHVSRVKQAYKISEDLQEPPFPDWATTDDNRVEVVIRYFDVLEEHPVKKSLRAHEYNVKNSYAYSHLVTVEVSPSRIEALASFPFVQYLELPNPPGEPEDLPARTLHRSNRLASPHQNNLSYNGDGVSIAVGDDGIIGPHVDFKGRLNQDSVDADDGDHGDMVAGIFTGAGNIRPTVKGMAYGADLHMYDVWRVIYSAYDHHSMHDVKVTNTSYSNGCNDGYTTFTEIADRQMNDMPTMIHVFSAGNDGNSDCGYGAGAGWGNVTGGVKIAKNVLCVANLNNEDDLAGSSSRGPAADGRIKPDISANGVSQMSTEPVNNYDPGGGTSAAAPGIAGVTAQLIDAYRSLNGGTDPKASLIKAAMLNTAEDLGNPGPDFKFGWGRVNAGRALETLRDHRYISGSVDDANANQHTLQVPSNTQQLRVMVYWLDPAGSVSASKALVNNLDLLVKDPSNQTYLPWVLDESPDPNTLDNPATRGTDDLNNMEQVTIDQPSAGSHTVEIFGSVVPKGPQEYVLVYEYRKSNIEVTYPQGDEPLVPGLEEKIRWDAFGQNSPLTISFSKDSGNTWQTIQSGVNPDKGFVDWQVPLQITDDALIQVSSGNQSDVSEQAFSIINQPQDLEIAAACPDAFKLTWNAVKGADRYDVFKLGSKYMDSVGTTKQTHFSFQQNDPGQTTWVSVRARRDDGLTGRRARAIKKSPGIKNCPLPNDLAVEGFRSPGSQVLQDCYQLDSGNVEIAIRNPGTNPQSGFTVMYQLDNGPVVQDTFQGSVAPKGVAYHTFDKPVDLTNTGQHKLTAWVVKTSQNTFYNDTTNSSFRVVNAVTKAPPFAEDFDTMATCGTHANCAEEVCPLSNGWINASNGSEDDIDWRVDSAGTDSPYTGPSNDHTLGNKDGKYIYLEASRGCEGKEAKLLSPCIDLTSMNLPTLSFWYHMKGGDMGELHVDVYTGDKWHKDVMKPLSGTQGGNWQKQEISLTQFDNDVITVRFRGITGDGYKSDVTIDDISIGEWTQTPAAQFQVEEQQACINSPRQFINYSKGASDYKWKFTPSNVSFLDSTDTTSHEPLVQFQSSGQYTVKLIASNNYGKDTTVQSSYINVNTVTSPPINADFEGAPALPADWTITNQDSGITWQSKDSVIGKQGQLTQAMYMNCFDYDQAEGERDILQVEPMDLAGSIRAHISFDIAYGPYSSNYTDRLIIEVSDDCGATFTRVYDREGATLATTSAQSNRFEPLGSQDWRTDRVDLTSFIGSGVIVRFISVNGYGNNIYLDNINIRTSQMPNASFVAPNTICRDDTMKVTSQMPASSNLTFNWQFGSGAEPASASGRGPHEISYDTAGEYHLRSIVANNAGADTAVQDIFVQPPPKAAFTYTIHKDTLTLNDLSSSSDNVAWHFGDGKQSMETNPIHAYQSTGTYDIRQIVQGNCGTDTAVRTITIDTLTGISPQIDKEEVIKVYPNPSNGQFTIRTQKAGKTPSRMGIFDIHGRMIRKIPSSAFQLADFKYYHMNIDLSDVSPGIYFLRTIHDGGIVAKKLIFE